MKERRRMGGNKEKSTEKERKKRKERRNWERKENKEGKKVNQRKDTRNKWRKGGIKEGCSERTFRQDRKTTEILFFLQCFFSPPNLKKKTNPEIPVQILQTGSEPAGHLWIKPVA